MAAATQMLKPLDGFAYPREGKEQRRIFGRDLRSVGVGRARIRPAFELEQ